MRTAQELNSLALRTRRLWNEDGYSPIDIFAIVNGWKDKKITIVRYPLSSRISGMCTKEKDDIVICINSTTSYGRQRFTLAHELYHVLYEEGMQRVICDMSMNGNKSDSEKEALRSAINEKYNITTVIKTKEELINESLIEKDDTFGTVFTKGTLITIEEKNVGNDTFNFNISIFKTGLSMKGYCECVAKKQSGGWSCEIGYTVIS